RVVPGTQLHLNRRNLDDAACVLDLADGDIAQAAAPDEALVLERRQRADTRRERHSGIDDVQLIQGNPLDAERTQARCARGTQMTPAPIGNPLAVWSRQTTLGGYDDAGTVA